MKHTYTLRLSDDKRRLLTAASLWVVLAGVCVAFANVIAATN